MEAQRVTPPQTAAPPPPVVWPVGGGKGGTGKSTFAANLGVGLALLGYRVVLVDGDLGGADLHVFLGQRPTRPDLGDFLSGTVPLAACVQATPTPGLGLVGGSHALAGGARVDCRRVAELIRQVHSLAADYVLLDLGAGTDRATMSLFAAADEGFVVTTPEPPARLDTYGFLKCAVYHRLRHHLAGRPDLAEVVASFARGAGRAGGRVAHLLAHLDVLSAGAGQEASEVLEGFRPRLVLNQLRDRADAREADRLRELAGAHLSVELRWGGSVRYDGKVYRAAVRRRPMLLDAPDSKAARDLFHILLEGLAVRERLEGPAPGSCRRLARTAHVASRAWA